MPPREAATTSCAVFVHSVSWKGSKKKKDASGKSGKKKVDLYALLGLAGERWMASEAQIKNAYRRVCLEHHPDKRLVGRVMCDRQGVGGDVCLEHLGRCDH
jgi:hypothetical protein